MTELMRLDRDGPIGILRFTQPGKRNPYSIGFVEDLVTCLRQAERDDTLRAVVMTGGDHFSSGGDLVGFQSEITKGARATSEMIDEVHEGGRAAYRFRKPLISAVCGVAYGAGLSLALSADIQDQAQILVASLLAGLGFVTGVFAYINLARARPETYTRARHG